MIDAQASKSLIEATSKLNALEVGMVLGVAILLVDKIIGWVVRLKGKSGDKLVPRCLEDETFRSCIDNVAANAEILRGVKETHKEQCHALENQTLVLDRIYQGQALQIKALDKIVEKLS